MADAKIISQEEYEAISSDLALFIGKMEKLEKNFNPKRLRLEIVNEFKLAMKENSIFQSLENESLELEDNLRALKNVRKEFIECKREKDLFLVLYLFLSFGFGSLITFLITKFY